MPLQFVGQFPQLDGQPVERLLEGRQQVEGHHDGEAHGGNGSQDGLIHGLGQQLFLYILDVDFLDSRHGIAVHENRLVGDDVREGIRDVCCGQIGAGGGESQRRAFAVFEG